MGTPVISRMRMVVTHRLSRFLVRHLATIIMLTFGLLLPLWYRLWSWAAGC